VLKGNVKSRLREAFTGATNESMQRLGKRGERKGFEQEWNTSTAREQERISEDEQEIRQQGIQQTKREHQSKEILIKPIGNENTAMRIQ